MQKVVAVNLNGHAYNVEEPGYEALVAYLDRAGARLASNPDRAEILADLEQAIAEKCNRLLGPRKTVVSTAEIEQILVEMGPVDAGDAEEAGSTADAAGQAGTDDPRAKAGAAAAPKRLYQIREGAMISGVCTGLAAYFDVDVTIIRVIFVLLAFVTKGVWLLVYGVMMFVIPYAETSEERAAARGRPFNAQQLIDEARRNLAGIKANSKDWKRNWRRQQREWTRHWRSAPYAWNPRGAYVAQAWAGAAAPLFGLINAAFALALVFTLFSLVTQHAVFGIALPSSVPLWAGILIVIAIYQVIALPFIAMQRAAVHPYAPGPLVWISPFAGLLWLGVVAFSIWYGYHHVPAVHEFIDAVLAAWQNAMAGLEPR